MKYQLWWGISGNVTSAGWQVRLCDPIWHVSFRSSVATSQTYLHSFNLSDASCELNIPEKCDFVHCMVIDFSSTFDQVGHCSSVKGGHSQPPPKCHFLLIVLKLSELSFLQPIKTSILQCSDIGLVLFIIMESDLQTISACKQTG